MWTSDLQLEVLECFAAFPHTLESFNGFIVRNPARQAEQTAMWKALHPARVKEHRDRYNRKLGHNVGGPPGPAGTRFTDQHGNVYTSLADAAVRCGLNRSSVHKALKTARTRKGFRFTYL